MKNILEYSKRSLVLLLTAAMIATSVPTPAFAATVDADDEVIAEAVTEDVVEESITEEDAFVEAEPEVGEAVEALGADEEPLVEEGDVVRGVFLLFHEVFVAPHAVLQV